MNAFFYPSKRGINFAKIRGFKFTDYSAAGGWSEAEVCAEELPLRGSQVAPSGELAAPREPSGTIGKTLPSMVQQRCHREEQPVGEVAEELEGRG